MRKTMIGAATAIMVIIGVWVWGCEGQQTPDMRTARLMAIENKELKAQMQAETKKRDDEIQKLEGQIQAEINKHNDDVQSLSNQLAQCEHDRTEGIKESEKKQQEQTQSVLTGVIQENQKLTAEIERLNAEIAKLKGQ
jgi:Skp family chaperone for outer membrane proteins